MQMLYELKSIKKADDRVSFFIVAQEIASCAESPLATVRAMMHMNNEYILHRLHQTHDRERQQLFL